MPTANTYTVGAEVRVSATFRDSTGTLADPTDLTGEYEDPSGTITQATPVKDGTGLYHFDIDVEASGTWYYRLAGTAAVKAAAEGAFVVGISRFS